jgi:hypothetical protein
MSHNFDSSIKKNIRRIFNGIKRRLIVFFRINKLFVGFRPIYSSRRSNSMITKLILSNKPFLASRFGTTEASALTYYRKNRQIATTEFPNNLVDNLWKLSGVFPPDKNIAARFCSKLIEISDDIDICGLRVDFYENQFWKLDSNMVQSQAKKAKLMNIADLCPIILPKSWLNALEGKKVLVIHPFIHSIETQFSQKEKLFEDPYILPDFNLITFKCIQSLSGTKSELGYENWFDALGHMEEQICSIDFDIALIGAGAYGIFLGSHIKNMGKQAIHIGGSLQLIFGIKGSRWTSLDSPDYLKVTENEHWIWPQPFEYPKNYLEVEGGAYWKGKEY